MRLLVDPRVDHFEVLGGQSLGFLLGQVAQLLVVRDLAHAANSPRLPLLTPLPLSRGGSVVLFEHRLLARLACGLTTVRLGSLPDRKRFHLLPRREHKLASASDSWLIYCFLTHYRRHAPCSRPTRLIANPLTEPSLASRGSHFTFAQRRG